MNCWWRSYEIADSQAGRLRLGPTEFIVENMTDEWCFGRNQIGSPLDSEVSIEIPCESVDWDSCSEVYRIAFDGLETKLHFVPALPDRSLITRAEHPLTIMPGDQATIFVNNPLWIKVLFGAARRQLVDLPIFRPSDTWFGPSSLEGELCYESKMPYRTMIENVPRRVHRVTTPVRVKNRSNKLLEINRFKVPVRYLSVFYDSGADRLMTEPVVFKQVGVGDVAELYIDRTQSSKVGMKDWELLCPPREKSDENFALRTFNSLFGGWDAF